METGWRDGFLFVGNQLSLDFLNTRPVIDGEAQELLPDAASLWRWLAAADFPVAPAKKNCAADDEAAMQQLRGFREDYRKVIVSMESGQDPPAAFLRHFNGLLVQHPFTDEIARSESGLARQRCYKLCCPADALYPLLDAVADLLTTADPARVRKCDNCVLHFLDVSKKGTRRWCSMQLCGNRTKVAAYAKRRKG